MLADDHPVVRRGLRSLLEETPDFRVIGEAGDGLEAAQLVARLRPDVLVLDLMMEGMNGLEVTRQVMKHSPGTVVVILSMYGNESYVLEALRCGAKAYVLKDSTADDLVHAIQAAAAGHRYLSPPLSERALERYIEKTEATELDPYDRLTVREREVLHLVASGCTHAEIAARLCISPRTVETHRARVMRKLGLRTTVQLIHYAMRRGILLTDD